MAIITTAQKLHDGPRNVVMQFTGRHDGGLGGDNETNVIKVDASELVPAGDRQLKLRKVTYDVNGGIVVLSWGGDDPSPFLNLGGNPGEFDYRSHGGLNNPGTADKTIPGDILISTLGFAGGSSYSVKMEMVKT